MSRRRKKSIDSLGPWPRLVWWLVLVLVLTITLFIRIRFLGIPLERDEGEYAYAGQLLLQGIPPYKLAYNMKFPGTYAAYALIMAVFGQSPTAVHFGFLLINLATIVLLFFVGRRLLGEIAGVTAASAYAILSVSPSVLGFSAHATHFVNLPLLGGLLLLLRSAGTRSLTAICCGGVLMGGAILMKQPGLYLALFGALYLLWTGFRSHLGWGRLSLHASAFAVGVILPIALTMFLLWRARVFAHFWFWTITYARAYAGINSFDIGRGYLVRNLPRVIDCCWLLWLMAGVGILVAVWHRRVREGMDFLFGFLAFSILAVSAGLYFQKHYFVLLLPVLSLLIGAAITGLTDVLARYKGVIRLTPLVLLIGALILPLSGRRDFYFAGQPDDALRQVWWDNPFAESIPIANYIRDHTDPHDVIAVLGSEPQIYFYAKRHSATGYIYTYGLMENHPYVRQMQKEMISEIEQARPRLIVFVSIESSWLMRRTSDRTVLDWVNNYLGANYTGVGLVNVFTDKPSEYYFPLIFMPPHVSQSRILLYRRNG